MSGLLLCGKKSDVPYRINDSDISIYSIEELAYYLFNNVYFIDDEFFTDNLAEYIEKNLNMKKIAGRLKLAERQRMSYVDKKCLPEVETAISSNMMEAKKRYQSLGEKHD